MDEQPLTRSLDGDLGAITPPPRRRKRLAALAALGIVVAGAIGGGLHWWAAARFRETTDDAYLDGDVTALSPHVAGFISEITVLDNQYVRAGQVLVRLDDRNFRAALDRALAVVQQRHATLSNLHAQRDVQLSAIQRAEAELTAAGAEAEFALQDARRYRNLVKQDAGSKQNAQKSAALDKRARATVAAAHAELDAQRRQLAVLDTQVEEARAALGEAEAEAETARLNLGYTEVRAPVDGYIGNRRARVGSYVPVGAYLLTVIPAQGLWIDANFKEDQLARMKPGQPATIVADVLPDLVLRGHVASLAPATGSTFSIIPAENATGNFTKIVQRVPVRIRLEAAGLPNALRPGLSTTVTVDTTDR